MGSPARQIEFEFAQAESRASLLEQLFTTDDPASCAEAALDWLARSCGIPDAVCLQIEGKPAVLRTIAVSGRARRDRKRFAIALTREHPLVSALAGDCPLLLNGSEVPRGTPLAPRPFFAVPLLVRGVEREAAGLLLVNVPRDGNLDSALWLARLLARRLVQIEQQTRLAETERRLHIEREQAALLKSQFLANMSHEFRTPLNAILGYTHLLMNGARDELDERQRKNLARIDANGRHLLGLIDDLLDISRIDTGRMPVAPVRFGVRPLLEELRREVSPLVKMAKLELSVRIESDMRPLYTDRLKVKQILANLLSNALKFTHQGRITLTARYLEAERLTSITVSDTGIGIAPGDLDRIFEDFRQLDDSPTRAYGGTGIGLSICRRLAGMLGGSITVRSRPGAGSSFTLHLPHQGRRR